MDCRNLIVNNIKLPICASFEEAFSVAKARLKKSGIKCAGCKFSVYRRSVDARKKDDIKFVYSIIVSGEISNVTEERLKAADAVPDKRVFPDPALGSKTLDKRPIIVGSGPAGLFCTLLLAEKGYSPILLERGGSISERKAAVERFNKFGVLDTETNIQFGAGGAGTFSDGKLITRINDGMSSYVLEKFVEFGADPEIKYLAKPHIGTDVLCLIVDRMIERIRSLGGEVRFNTALKDITVTNGRISRIFTSEGEEKPGLLVLAIGHSARDTYEMLLSKNIIVEAKDFSVGMRIEHLTEDIDRAMYGKNAGNDRLGHAEYALSHNTKERGVYTFCMCPGGEVVAAASEHGGLVVNGMSEHSRSGKNSNSAVVCSIFRSDYGSTPMSAINFQRKIERAAFSAGGKDYSAPIITFSDFAGGTLKKMPSRIIPSYRGGEKVKLAAPESYLPDFVCDSIRNAIFAFEKKISGFASGDAVLTGAETRTSAPVRITRDPESRRALGISNLYPCGEGRQFLKCVNMLQIRQ